MAAQPQRARGNDRQPIAGEAFLRALADHGIREIIELQRQTVAEPPAPRG